jgi:phage tail sheath protein FI
MTIVNTPHPGVYIAEIPSGVRSITGVATSITANMKLTAADAGTWAKRATVRDRPGHCQFDQKGHRCQLSQKGAADPANKGTADPATEPVLSL